MIESGAPTAAIALETYGVRVAMRTDSAQVLERLKTAFPPCWARCEPGDPDIQFTVTKVDGGFYSLVQDGEVTAGDMELDVAVEVIAFQLQHYVALHAPDTIFVHAGVVAHEDRAIVIPGVSFSGKTTLVAELVRAGATYYSDEYAVLDEQGFVHPYARPLSIRAPDFTMADHDVETLGGSAGETPVRIGLAIVAHYQPGARWEPRRLSPGESVLALLANTVPAQERPAQALSAIKHAIDGAIVLEGERGEATDIVEQVVSMLRT
jgi:hypothetical protein